jgi:hypothetical protein
MQTLEQLKAENAEPEVKTDESIPQAEEVKAEEEAVEEESEELVDPGEGEQTDTEGAETEAWMQTEEQTSEGSDNETVVPLASHIKMRGTLKAKIGDQSGEIEQLNAKIALLEQGRAAPAQETATPAAMPTLEGSDFDEAKYQQELSSWMAKQVQAQVAHATQASTKTAAQTQAAQQLDQAVDGHYQRAAKLAEESGITPELYQNADTVVRQTIESVLPKMGDIVTDNMIARLGEGSEKVMYFLGRNKTAQEKLRSSLVTDPTGISAALYLGELKSTVATPQKRVSRARKPATQIQGDEGGSAKGAAKKLKETYSSAHKRGQGQAAYNAKKQAKAAGIDVSDW